MEHPTAPSPASPEPSGDRLARTQWLITELRDRANSCADPTEQANLRRSADSLARLCLALRP